MIQNLYHKIYEKTCPQPTKPRTFSDHHRSLLFKCNITDPNIRSYSVTSTDPCRQDSKLDWNFDFHFTHVLGMSDLCEHLHKGSNGRSKALEASLRASNKLFMLETRKHKGHSRRILHIIISKENE